MIQQPLESANIGSIQTILGGSPLVVCVNTYTTLNPFTPHKDVNLCKTFLSCNCNELKSNNFSTAKKKQKQYQEEKWKFSPSVMSSSKMSSSKTGCNLNKNNILTSGEQQQNLGQE